ncbi:MAG: LuxR C-terminal-related transcriptional regulator [Bryobacteraceae bacterium]
MERGKRANRILIADGQLLFRRGLRALLSAEADMQVVDEAGDTTEALLKVQHYRPDVLVMDLALLEQAGSPAPATLRQAQPGLPILFLTKEDGPEHLELAISAGARGYMLKSSAPAEIVAGVRRVILHDEQNPQALSLTASDLQALAGSNHGYTRPAMLTPREREVMRLLAEGRTVREVAAELALSIKTIEAHKLNLMRKLNIHNRASLVEYAVQQGIAVRNEPAPVLD